jgi:hypothetical protein
LFVNFLEYYFPVRPEKFNTARPKIPDTADPAIIASLEKTSIYSEEKESPDMNSDMVKPIPPSRLIPKIRDHFIPGINGA